VARFIDVEDRFSGKGLQQFLVGLLQSRADLGDDLEEERTREVDLDHIAEELANSGIGGVTETFEVSDQGSQARADQAATFDPIRQDAVMDLAAMGHQPGWLRCSSIRIGISAISIC